MPDITLQSATDLNVRISLNELVEAARNGNIITCIKLVRQLTGMGLKDCKDAVEHFSLYENDQRSIEINGLLASLLKYIHNRDDVERYLGIAGAVPRGEYIRLLTTFRTVLDECPPGYTFPQLDVLLKCVEDDHGIIMKKPYVRDA